MPRFAFAPLILATALSARAEMSVDFDKDRIEAGKSFVMSLVVPLREIPENRGAPPQLGDTSPFVLSKSDSVDDVQTDFFMRGIKVRRYRFHLQAPRQEGRYTLKPQWDINGTLRNLGSVGVQVQRPYDAPALVASLTPDRRSVYEGEQIALTLALVSYPGWQGKASPITTDLGNDFVLHRSDMKNFQFARSQRPGAEMEASGLFAWVSPVRTGTLTIPAMKFGYTKVGAPKVIEKNTGNFSFRSVTQEPEDAITSSAPIQIEVKPLPSGAPEGFSGLVGKYEFNGELDKQSLQVGEAATITLTIRGNGKPGTIPDPALPSFADFRSVPPESKVGKSEVKGQIITEKVIRLFLYPRKAGSFTIAPIRFSWFDPSSKSYRIAETPAWTLQVEKGTLTEEAASGGSDTPARTVESKEIEQLGNDIRHIHPGAPLAHAPLHRSPWFWVLLALPFALLPAAYILRTARLRRLGNAALQRRSQAAKALRHRMGAARDALEKNDSRAFHTALSTGVMGYLGDQWNEELRGLVRDDLDKRLEAHGMPAEQRAQLRQLLEACDFARFAPVAADRTRMTAMLRDTENLCTSLEVRP